jgi:ribose/xylose/arabinose/galactoside ABC-type transport system permease subunit
MTVHESKIQRQPEQQGRPPSQSKTIRLLVGNFPAIVLFLVFAIISIFVPYFFTASNLISVLVQASSLAMMAIGITTVLITGGIDLSIPGMMALGAIAGGMFIHNGGNPIVGALIMVVVSTVLGAVNGFAVSYLKMIPFVVTLAMQVVTTGTAIWITKETTITGFPQVYMDTVLGTNSIPMPAIYVIILVIIVQLILTRTIYGRWLYAVGTNIRAARVSGVPTQRVVFSAFAFSGFMAGLAAIILTARLASAGAPMGKDSMIMDVIAAAAIGGVSTFGGIGTALNAVFGAILVTLISNVLNMAHVSYYLTLVAKGLIIVSVVAIDGIRRQKRGKL